MRRYATVLLLLFLPTVGAAQQAVQRAANSITAEDLRARIGVLAHDSMRGRDTPSPEIEQAARYVGDQFRRFGLRPGGDAGSFVQHYPIQRVRVDTARSRIDAGGGVSLRFPTQAARVLGGFAPAGVSGSAVLVSGAPSQADLAKAPLKGAVVVYVDGGERGPSRQVLFGLYEAEPAALLIVVDASEAEWGPQAAAQLTPSVSVPWRESNRAPAIAVRRAAIAPVLAKHGVDVTRRRQASAMTPLPSLTLTVTVAPEVVQETSGPNTVGILEGSDPALRGEYIVFSAHMDHVGVGRPVGGDSIYNGADDDASGTAAIIELAEAYAQLNPRPRRSMIFLTVSGEEKGLWGSDYFAQHPPVPIERMVANINMDMIGRNWRDTVVVIGKEHSDLGATLERVSARHRDLNMTAIDDIWPEERFYFRSDHVNFARRGVPVLFFFTGTHEDYHRPSDHVEKIDVEKQARIVRLVFHLGLEVANAAARPQWNPESYAEIVGGGR